MVEGVQVWVGDEDKEVCGVKIVVCSEVFKFLLQRFLLSDLIFYCLLKDCFIVCSDFSIVCSEVHALGYPIYFSRSTRGGGWWERS